MRNVTNIRASSANFRHTRKLNIDKSGKTPRENEEATCVAKAELERPCHCIILDFWII